jgi:hypothetical protein
LDNSSTYRNSNDTLLAFYDSLNTAIIEHINATETNIANLIQSMNSQNYELYVQRLEEANSSNSNVVSEEEQESNEHDINEIYIKMLTYGIDSLDSEDSNRIVEIANLCPYIGGTAVYKARTLFSMYNPANMFDDIAMCNAIGVYKQENNNNDKKGIFDEENTYLQSLKPKENVLVSLSENKFILYPNPANANINIKYQLNSNQIGNVVICDLLGRQRMIINLASDIIHVTANINSLETGVYIYKYIVNYNLVETGKLLKE